MIGESRQQFIGRVRKALTNRGDAVELPIDLEIARVISSRHDLVRLFMERAEEAKMHAYRVAGEADVPAQVAAIMNEVQAGSFIITTEAIPARQQIIDTLTAKGVQMMDATDREAAFVADVGITTVDAAIAETASLVLSSGPNRPRLASLAVPIHLTIMRAEQIVPDLLDWTAAQSASMPAATTLVSNPSKTADIELNLVMGVHGPKQEYIVVIG